MQIWRQGTASLREPARKGPPGPARSAAGERPSSGGAAPRAGCRAAFEVNLLQGKDRGIVHPLASSAGAESLPGPRLTFRSNARKAHTMEARTLVLLAGLAAVAAPAAAAEPDKAPTYVATGWRLECANAAKGLECQVGQRVVVKDSGQLVAMVGVRVPAETRKPLLVAQTPLGILVSQPVVLKVDGANPVNLTVETCRPEGCFANTPLPDAFANAARSGKELNLSFKGVDGQTVNMTLPLEGFAAAYARAK